LTAASGEHARALIWREVQRVREAPNGLTVWKVTRAALEVGNATSAQPSSFSQRFLGQPTPRSVPAQ
jgi:hypothetical protein